MITFTTKQVAELEKCSLRVVQKWCAKQGMNKTGRDYIFDGAELMLFRARPKPGNPHNRKNISQDA